MTDTTPAPPALAGSVRARPLEPLPQGSESLEVWAVNQEPWEKLGTIIRRRGRHGTITCTPQWTFCSVARRCWAIRVHVLILTPAVRKISSQSSAERAAVPTRPNISVPGALGSVRAP